MELDRHKLEEERRWRLVNYQQQVKRMVTSLVDAIQQEAKRALEREVVYDDDGRVEYSYVRQAGDLQHAILQAVNNADFGGLTRDAGELHAVEMGLHTLLKLKESLPPEVRELFEQREDEKQLALLEGKLADKATREKAQAEQCRASVHEGGRGVGFHQCQKKGSREFVVDGRPGYLGNVVPEGTPGSITVKLCGTHAKEADRGKIHVWTPNDWEEGQAKIYAAKSRAEIERLRASLPPQLTAGDTRKQLPVAAPVEFAKGDRVSFNAGDTTWLGTVTEDQDFDRVVVQWDDPSFNPLYVEAGKMNKLTSHV